MIELAQGVSMRSGKAVYPEDLDKDEFHSILIKMLKAGKYFLHSYTNYT